MEHHPIAVVGGHVHIPPAALGVDRVPLVVAPVLEETGDARLLAEELEAVRVGHTSAPEDTVLGQHFTGPDVAGLVVGDAVADIPGHALNLLPVAQPSKAGDEVLGVFGGGNHVFRIPCPAEVSAPILRGNQLVAWVSAQGSEDGLDLLDILLTFLEQRLVIPILQPHHAGDGRAEGSGLTSDHCLTDGVVDLSGEVAGERRGAGLGGAAGERRYGLLLIGTPAGDDDRVGLRVVAHTEVHRLADVPKFYEVVPFDGVGFQFHPLTVHEELLGAGGGLEPRLCGRGHRANEGRSYDNSCCQCEDVLLSFHAIPSFSRRAGVITKGTIL